MESGRIEPVRASRTSGGSTLSSQGEGLETPEGLPEASGGPWTPVVEAPGKPREDSWRPNAGGLTLSEPVFFFCCSVSFVVGSLKDEPGRWVSE